MSLNPFLKDVQIYPYTKGRYEVRLEVPLTSTLTSSEIERILALSSWEVNPNQTPVRFEGGRSLLISRDQPITKKGISLEALQVLGIGYKPIQFQGPLGLIADHPFQPPNHENFLDLVSGTIMSTSRARGFAIETTRPKYRALGTFVASELQATVENTADVSSLDLEDMVVPHVEAYGRYPQMGNKEGPFGFLVLPVPSLEKPRAFEEMHDQLSQAVGTLSSEGGINYATAFMANYYLMSVKIAPLILGLRDLHEHRRAHLQPHLSNLYVVNGKAYIMDWTTMVHLETNTGENIINRMIDLLKPCENFDYISSTLFGLDPIRLAPISVIIKELVLEVYSRNTQKKISMLDLLDRASDVFRHPATDDEIIAQWLKDQGLEGFPRWTKPTSNPVPQSVFIDPAVERLLRTQPRDLTVPVRSEPKIGRNDPCPCGSGSKYKKCCLE